MTVIFGEKEKFLRSPPPSGLPLTGLFVVLMGIAIALRFSGLGRFSFWLDEYTSIEVASKSIGDILTGAGFDRATPPFYYFLLHGYLRVVELAGLPISEESVRFLSAVIDCFSLLIIYQLALRIAGPISGPIKGKSAAVGAALFYGFLEFPIYFAQEGRMYSLLALECLLTLRLLLPLRELSRGKAALLALVAACGLYTHYYYAFFAFGTGLALLLEYPREPRAFVRGAGAFIIAGAAFIPWIQVIVGLSKSGGQIFRPLSILSIPYALFRFAAGFAVFPLDSAAKADQGAAIRANIIPVGGYLLLSTVLLCAGLAALWKSKSPNRWFILLPILTSTTLPLLISLKIPMFSERYLSGIYPLICILYSLGALALAQRARVAIPILAALILYPLYAHLGGEPHFAKEQWRETVSYLRSHAETSELIIDPPYIRPLLGFYCPECRPVPLSKWGGKPGVLLRRGEGEAPNPPRTALRLETSFPAESGLFLFHIEPSMTPQNSSDTVGQH